MFRNPFAARGDFFRNVVTLMTGTTIAQVVPLLASPILRRIFSPEEFGVLALYISISSLAVIFGTGQYHIAVVLPKRQKDAVNIVALCLLLGVLVSVLTLAGIFVYAAFLANATSTSDLLKWAYFIPLKVFTASCILTFDAWAIRKKRFSSIAKSRVIQAFLTVSFNISAGLLGLGIYALIIGSALGDFGHIAYITGVSWNQERSYLKVIRWPAIKHQARENRKFPLYSLPADIVSTAGSEMPILLLNTFFGKTVLGYLSLTQRMIAIPTAIISNAALEVFKERASSEYRTKGNCRETFKKTFAALAGLGFLMFLGILFLSPSLIRLVFGSDWATSGRYAQILSPYFLMSFVVSPLSYMFFIAGKQREDFLLHAYISISVPLSLILGNYLFQRPEPTLFLYAINYSIIYLFYLIRSFYLSKGKTSTPAGA